MFAGVLSCFLDDVLMLGYSLLVIRTHLLLVDMLTYKVETWKEQDEK